MKRPPCVVPDVDENTLREIYGVDADHVIAFKRFLACPKNEDGKTLVSPEMYRWATGKITAAELLGADAS